MTKFKKDDLVRVHATRFNAPDGKKDKNGRTFVGKEGAWGVVSRESHFCLQEEEQAATEI
jgi:hypothetical protein